MFRTRVHRTSLFIAAGFGERVHERTERLFEHGVRRSGLSLVSQYFDRVSARLGSGIAVRRDDALTQSQIEDIAANSQISSDWSKKIPLLSFEQLASRTQHRCSCPDGLRQRHQRRSISSETEAVCSLIASLGDRFGTDPRLLTLLEERITDAHASSCVRKAGAEVLRMHHDAETVKKRIVSRLQRRSEWEGVTRTQKTLIARLS